MVAGWNIDQTKEERRDWLAHEEACRNATYKEWDCGCSVRCIERSCRYNVMCRVCSRIFKAPDEKPVPCRTHYANNTRNIDPVLCAECAIAYNEHWDQMWADHRGQS